jgi:hypothetical protein
MPEAQNATMSIAGPVAFRNGITSVWPPRSRRSSSSPGSVFTLLVGSSSAQVFASSRLYCSSIGFAVLGQLPPRFPASSDP